MNRQSEIFEAKEAIKDVLETIKDKHITVTALPLNVWALTEHVRTAKGIIPQQIAVGSLAELKTFADNLVAAVKPIKDATVKAAAVKPIKVPKKPTTKPASSEQAVQFTGPLLPGLPAPKNVKVRQTEPLTLSSKGAHINTSAMYAAKLQGLQAQINALQPTQAPKVKTLTVIKQREGGQPVQNNVRMPKPETACGKSWAICNVLLAEKGALIFTAKDVIAVGNTQGINKNTTGSEFYMWKKYHAL